MEEERLVEENVPVGNILQDVTLATNEMELEPESLVFIDSTASNERVVNPAAQSALRQAAVSEKEASELLSLLNACLAPTGVITPMMLNVTRDIKLDDILSVADSCVGWNSRILNTFWRPLQSLFEQGERITNIRIGSTQNTQDWWDLSGTVTFSFPCAVPVDQTRQYVIHFTSALIAVNINMHRTTVMVQSKDLERSTDLFW